LVKNNRLVWQDMGRLFLCFVIALRTNGITKIKTGNA